jgi:hypothetical protein
MTQNRQSLNNKAFQEHLRLLKDAEIAVGVGAPDPKLIWFCFVASVALALLCMFFAVSGNRVAANIALVSLWPLFGLLTFFQRSSRFKRKVQG